MAALGGMVKPAAICFLLQRGQPGEPGWGIPMATDIAFVVGFLAHMGKRVPLGLKILLLSLAIADDIGAVLVIALFYASSISGSFLGMVAFGFCLTFFINRIGVRRVPVYMIAGAVIWFAFLKSGVHPNVVGVLLGLLTLASAWVGDKALLTVIEEAWKRKKGERDGQIENHQKPALDELQFASCEAVLPLELLETALHPWVAFGIMPIFSLANSDVSVDLGAVAHPVSSAVVTGLVLSKPLGILVFSWLAVCVGLARLPTGVN